MPEDRVLCVSSCGAWPCGHPYQCAACRVVTMRANGFPPEWAAELDGLRMVEPGYIDPWKHTAVMAKLREMAARQAP